MKIKKATAFAPATVANVAVGFDILGFALKGLGETATVEKISSREVVLMPIKGYENLSTNPLKNTATAGLVRLIKDKNFDFGFKVSLKKNIPVGSGLGGSSTSAVAAIVAANSLLPKKLTRYELLDYALTGEEVASGSRHGDNIAPCLEGGLVFVRSQPQISSVRIKTPKALRCVIVLPELSINTKDARGLLVQEISLKKMIEQTANLSGFLIGCLQNDMTLIKESLKDVVIEPQRARLVPGFYDLQSAALKAGALGCSLSGSGPAIFALTANQKIANQVQKEFLATARKKNIRIKGSWISPIASHGAHLL